MPPHCYFITYDNVPEITLDGDTLRIPGVESYEGILAKTLTAFDYFLSRDSYDFVVRTNISSIWDYPKLLEKLSTLPRSGYYGGSPGGCFDSVTFVSGSGMILTPDVCKKLSDAREVALSFQNIDDVDIGLTCHHLGIPMDVSGIRIDIYSGWTLPPGGYHYRVRLQPFYTQTGDPVMIDHTINCMERVKCLMSSP
jgi:hypothetical protein